MFRYFANLRAARLAAAEARRKRVVLRAHIAPVAPAGPNPHGDILATRRAARIEAAAMAARYSSGANCR